MGAKFGMYVGKNVSFLPDVVTFFRLLVHAKYRDFQYSTKFSIFVSSTTSQDAN